MTTVPTPHTDATATQSHLVLKGHANGSPNHVFRQALVESFKRAGKPVRVTNFVQGISLLIETANAPVLSAQAESIFDFMYAGIEPRLRAWLRLAPSDEPLCHEVLGVTVRFSHTSHLQWLPGALDIEVEHPYDVLYLEAPDPVPATAAAPVTGASSQSAIDSSATTATGKTILKALDLSEYAHADLFRLLPLPIRYRASGAIDAWNAARRADGKAGAYLEAALADGLRCPVSLAEQARLLVFSHLRIDASSRDGALATQASDHSVPMQAFWLRKGALYEPSETLEELLRMSDLANDMPLGMLPVGARALCIVPGPSLRHAPDCVDSIMVFDSSGLPAGTADERWLTFIVSRSLPREHTAWRGSIVRLRVDGEPVTTIRDAVDHYCVSKSGVWLGHDANEDNGRDYWNRVLSYAVKVLLYLSSENPQITQDFAYTHAPRNFGGLGKRKKTERLREIEHLYDRYIVGPESLPSLAVHAKATGTGESGELSPHWRRGHFRLQRYGPGLGQTRIIFIMPVVVRSDRLQIIP